jgi:hypothetical protein
MTTGADMAEDETEARGATDRLALALEDAGFDVGQDFPALHDAIGRQGFAVVRMGDVRPSIADRLATVVSLGSAVTGLEEDDNR